MGSSSRWCTNQREPRRRRPSLPRSSLRFTALPDTASENRPSFSHAAPPEAAAPLVEHFCSALSDEGVSVRSGTFGAKMEVELVNDGPVTIVLDV
jgi:D-tyrosyl-tRNA(Tyr) deacylase